MISVDHTPADKIKHRIIYNKIHHRHRREYTHHPEYRASPEIKWVDTTTIIPLKNRNLRLPRRIDQGISHLDIRNIVANESPN
jgi:hypothetical protein